MEAPYETELVKNCLIPMSDGVTLAADLYRPWVDDVVSALLSFYPYHKDAGIGPGFFERALQRLAQAGYACLLVDVRGTGNSGGWTVSFHNEYEQRDYYDTVEWAADQPWCDGNVGVWGWSYGSIAGVLAAAQGPPHLRAVAAIEGAPEDEADSSSLRTGGLDLLQSVANWLSWMAGQNFMPPAYRDAEGRWLSVWREHLKSNTPWLVSALDRASSDEVRSQAAGVAWDRIETPIYLFTGWHDIFTKATVEAYQRIQGPKKLTVGPWVHVMPDAGHTGRIDYLHELQRWFDYWLRGRDTGIMDEPPIAIWVQGTETWFHEEHFPPSELDQRTFYLGAGRSLSESLPTDGEGGVHSFEYDATVGVCCDLWEPQGLGVGLALDQRVDELKGITYTAPPLKQDMEICGVPEAVIQHSSTAPEAHLVVKLCDVHPDGRSSLITMGWVDATRPGRHAASCGQVSEHPASVHLNLIPTAYVLRAGHRLRAFLAGANFPHLLPSRGPGQISIMWGKESVSLVRLPVRRPRGRARKPVFPAPRGSPRVPVRAGMWQIEQDPVEMTVSVRTGHSLNVVIDGGVAPATVSCQHRCAATASQSQPSQASAYAESLARWESERERIELQTAMVFRPVDLELSINITTNGMPYWKRNWSRNWRNKQRTIWKRGA